MSELASTTSNQVEALRDNVSRFMTARGVNSIVEGVANTLPFAVLNEKLEELENKSDLTDSDGELLSSVGVILRSYLENLVSEDQRRGSTRFPYLV